MATKFHGQETAPGSLALTGKITGTNHPFVEHFKFLKQFEDEDFIVKQTIPAPAQFYFELIRDAEHIEQNFLSIPFKRKNSLKISLLLTDK